MFNDVLLDLISLTKDLRLDKILCFWFPFLWCIIQGPWKEKNFAANSSDINLNWLFRTRFCKVIKLLNHLSTAPRFCTYIYNVPKLVTIVIFWPGSRRSTLMLLFMWRLPMVSWLSPLPDEAEAENLRFHFSAPNKGRNYLNLSN